MAEVLVTGKKISDMTLVSDILGTEKIPTDVAGDKAVTTGQLLTYLDLNGRSGWGRIDGDITLQADLMNKFNQQDLELANHAGNTDNPHEVTKDQVGLGNVDNTSDLNKPISTATQGALNSFSTDLSNHASNQLNPHNVTKTQVGLGNVDDTSDANKPISLATQNALNLKTDSVEFEAQKNFLDRGNRYKYNATLSPYSKGQIIQSDNELSEFLSLVDNNTINPNTEPLGTSWKVYTGEGSVPDASSTVKGVSKLIDNLTTADSLSSLSASQGKVLQDNKLNTTQAFGVGQTWQDVTALRSSSTTYTNSTGKPIEIAVMIGDDGSSGLQPLTVTISSIAFTYTNLSQDTLVKFTIPDSGSYRFDIGTNTIKKWAELRS